MTGQNNTNPLDIPFSNALVKFVVEKLTGLNELKALYQSWLDSEAYTSDAEAKQLLDFILETLEVKISIDEQYYLSKVPASGPLIFVSNHPLGALEGMLLSRLLLKLRPDLKVLTNQLLLNIPEFNSLFIGVDILNPRQQQSNSKGIRSLSKHLIKGGAALVFPAGKVSGINLRKLQIEDSEWNEMVARLALKYQCSVVPMYVKDTNKLSFYLSGLIHKRLRTLLLGRAMLSKKQCVVDTRIGDTISRDEINQLGSPGNITEYFRLCSELLAKSSVQPAESTDKLSLTSLRMEVDDSKLILQLEKLVEYKVFEQGKFTVYCAPYSKLGCFMEQIAICREQTFRAVDEGSGNELDSDQFDQHYWHLWVWDTTAKKIVGGYRMAKVDQVIQESGINNLYSRCHYQYDIDFVNSLGKVIEVGRSFVSPEYQRHPRALDLLWKGIGAFMVNNPDYHTLFGGVSISQQYSNLARAFLADSFLYHYSASSNIRTSVKAANPLTVKDKPWGDSLIDSCSDIPFINKLLGRIDNGKSIPILIRHYLALNGRFISFSLNHNFNESLDGLIMVDLRCAPDKYLNRYLGLSGAKAFKKKWDINQNVA